MDFINLKYSLDKFMNPSHHWRSLEPVFVSVLKLKLGTPMARVDNL